MVPPEWVKTEEDKKKAQEWATTLGVELAPTEVSDGTTDPLVFGTIPGGTSGSGGGSPGTPDSPAAIYSPGAGNGVGGIYGPTLYRELGVQGGYLRSSVAHGGYEAMSVAAALTLKL